MTLRTTLGQLMINRDLPEDLRDYNRVLDKKGIASLLQQVAEQRPEQYREIAKRLSDIGRDVSYTTGGHSFGLQALRPAAAAKRIQLELQQQLDAIYADPKLTPAQKEKRVIELTAKRQKQLIDDVLQESRDEDNPLARQLIGAGRGNPFFLNSLRGADLLYTDHRGRVVPLPVLRNYSQGLRPSEYFAGAFGTRKGIIDLKLATADAGFFAKQLVQATHRLLVEAEDDDMPYDSTSPRGLPVDVDDADNEGAFLAHPVGGYDRNTLLTPRILKDLKNRGFDRILVRSPIVGGAPHGGVYARDVGRRERGAIAPVGDYVGIAAAQALCLAAGTLVRMADGTTRRVEDIKAGDMVMGADIAGRLRPVEVLAKYDNGLRDCRRFLFRRGTGNVRDEALLDVVATPDHKYLSEVVIRTNRAAARRLPYFSPVAVRRLGTEIQNRHDYICAKLGESYDDEGHVPEPYALLFGLLTGDGGLTVENRIGFTCYDPLLGNDLERELRPLGLRCGGKLPNLRLVDTASCYMKKDGNGRYRNRLKRRLMQEGLWGCHAWEKTLPKHIWQWDNRSVAAFISGYLATDGYVLFNSHGRGIGFGSSSRRLIEGVRDLMAVRFGIYGSTIKRSQKKGEHSGRPQWAWTVNAGDMIQKLGVLHVPGCKQKKLETIIQEATAINSSTRARFVRSEPVGLRPTYDIYVAHPDHLFVLANGLIVSNSEPITQANISSKHSGGVAGASAGAIAGFKRINQLVQVPKHFPGGAAHAQLDGRVQQVREAPQGGHYVTINGKDHYVGTGFQVNVKPGDNVEAGDVLSDGIPNPAEIVKHKGIGEGRRYFVDAFRQAIADAGQYGNRRNIELVARGLINHVRLTDEVGDYVPGDVVPYQMLERSWQPRDGHLVVRPQQAVGYYLERPVLHYAIGTRIRPTMLKELEKFGVQQVYAHRDPPPFAPEMIRGMANVAHDPDWMTRMLGSYQQKSLLEGARRGAVSDELGTSYAPALARGEYFGRYGASKGWDPATPETRDHRTGAGGQGPRLPVPQTTDPIAL